MRRRRPAEGDPLSEVPEELREFDPRWLKLAATGPEGYEEAQRAADEWRAARHAWTDEHGYRGSPLEWLRASAQVHRRVWAASEVWRPASQRRMMPNPERQHPRDLP